MGLCFCLAQKVTWKKTEKDSAEKELAEKVKAELLCEFGELLFHIGKSFSILILLFWCV